MSVITKVSSFISLFKKAIKGEEQEYTSGSIDRAIFLLSVPMIFEMSMEAIFAIVDVYFVGRLHDNDAISVIGLTESVLALIYSLAMGLSMAATAMVARRVGEKDIKSAEVAAAQAIYIGLAMAALISVVGMFFSENILRLMGGSETLIANNVGYTRWMLTGNVTIMLIFSINAVFLGAGDDSLAMRSLLLANI